MIFVGSDHVGFLLKKKVIQYLKKRKIAFLDIGPSKFSKNDDYPDYGFKVAEKVGQSLGEGILICKMSGGMTIVANKVKGVRAVACASPRDARFAKEHDHANVICLASLKVGGNEKILKILNTWFSTAWSNEPRHVRRVKKISQYESKNRRAFRRI